MFFSRFRHPGRSNGVGVTESLVVERTPLHVWLDTLPLGNPVGSLDLVDRYLLPLLRGELNGDQCRYALERVWPTVVELNAALVREFAGHMGQSGEHSVLLERLQAVWGVLADLAGQLLCELESDASFSDREERVAFAGHRVIAALSQQVNLSYLSYRAEPAGAWLSMHQAYGFCRQHGVENRKVRIVLRDSEEEDTPSLAYRRLILLALSNPYGLMAGEAATLPAYFASLAQWLKLDESAVPDALCIDPDKDSGPFIPDASALSPSLLGINMDTVFRVVKERIAGLNSKLSESEEGVGRISERIHRDMLLRLLRAWHSAGGRRGMRERVDAPLTVTVGLGEIFRRISEGMPYRPEEWEKEYRLVKAGDPVERLEILPLDVQAWLEPGGSDRIRYSFTGEEESEASLPGVAQELQCTCVDESQGGMQLRVARDCLGRLRVGTLLAFRLQQAGRGRGWLLGALRWIRLCEGKSAILGVQYLVEDAVVVAVRAFFGVGAGGEYLRALRGRDLSSESGEELIFVPAAFYATGTHVVMMRPGELRRARLTEQVEANRMYAGFRFEALRLRH